jgi:ribosome-associated toxin RatA of RatAB toxin-antitoxin module
MAGATREETFDISAERYYDALLDYARYPEILPEVDKIDVLEKSESSARVQYSIQLLKSFTYILKMTHKRPNSISWVLESGSFFKTNNGSWTIEALGPESCRVKYSLEVEFKIFAPAAITNKLVAVNLPRMMKSFYEKAKQA